MAGGRRGRPRKNTESVAEPTPAPSLRRIDYIRADNVALDHDNMPENDVVHNTRSHGRGNRTTVNNRQNVNRNIPTPPPFEMDDNLNDNELVAQRMVEQNSNSNFSNAMVTFERYVQAIQNDYQSFGSLVFEESTIAECKMRLNVLHNRMERLIEAKDQLTTTEDAHIEFLFKDAEDSYNASKIFLTERIQQLQRANQRFNVTQANQPNIVVNFDASQMLPPVPLPSFNGSYAKWREFKSQYVPRVHQNSKLTASDKLYRLKNALTGEAAMTIGTWEISDENYDKAWSKLCNVFDNDYMIVRSHVQQILGVEALSFASATGIRHLIDTVSNAIQQLNVLQANTTELILIQLMESKIDQQTRRDWDLHRDPNAVPTLSEFNAFLERNARMLANQALRTVEPVKTAKATERYQPYARNNQTGRTNSFKNNRKLPPCRMCQADHGLFACPKFLALSINARTQKVHELDLCVVCLGRHNPRSPCPKMVFCRNCKTAAHNTVLCPKSLSNNDNVTIRAITSHEETNASTSEQSGVEVTDKQE